MSVLDLSITLRTPQDFSGSAMIFDCDRTLVDSTAVHPIALRKALKPYGLEMNEQWYFSRVGMPLRALLEAYEKEIGRIPASTSASIEEHNRHYNANLSLLRAIPPVVEIARARRGKIPLCVASGGLWRNVQATLDGTGLRDLFDHIVTIEEVERGNSSPDLTLLGTKKTNVPPAECLVFDDSNEGVAATRTAGIKCIDVRTLKDPVH